MRRQKADRLLKNLLSEIAANGKLPFRSAVICRDGQVEGAWKASSSPLVMLRLISLCCDEYIDTAAFAVSQRARTIYRKEGFDSRRKIAEAIRRIVPVMTMEMLLRASR